MRLGTLGAALALAVGLSAGPSALAQDAVAGGISIDRPWSRATAAEGATGVVYMVLENGSDAPDRLVGVSSPRADRAELHRTVEQDGLMRMLHVEAIEIPAGGAVALEPGGYHAMLFRLDRALAVGETVPVTLVFERAGAVEIESVVEAAGTASPSHGHEGHGGH